eukprot:762000-Hanusia_phi.AAC.3
MSIQVKPTTSNIDSKVLEHGFGTRGFDVWGRWTEEGELTWQASRLLVLPPPSPPNISQGLVESANIRLPADIFWPDGLAHFQVVSESDILASVLYTMQKILLQSTLALFESSSLFIFQYKRKKDIGVIVDKNKLKDQRAASHECDAEVQFDVCERLVLLCLHHSGGTARLTKQAVAVATSQGVPGELVRVLHLQTLQRVAAAASDEPASALGHLLLLHLLFALDGLRPVHPVQLLLARGPDVLGREEKLLGVEVQAPVHNVEVPRLELPDPDVSGRSREDAELLAMPPLEVSDGGNIERGNRLPLPSVHESPVVGVSLGVFPAGAWRGGARGLIGRRF